jgi:tripartite-type tricarboxylate transporter receptor subunit TctC
VKPEDRPLLEFMSRSSAVGRPLGTTPGVPGDRVAALRAAFTRMIADKDFMADAKKHNMDIRPTSGEALAKLISDIVDTPPEIRERVKRAMEPNEGDVVK